MMTRKDQNIDGSSLGFFVISLKVKIPSDYINQENLKSEAFVWDCRIQGKRFRACHAAMFRVGILAALRSLKTRSVTSVMITTSHNQVSDNGVCKYVRGKLVISTNQPLGIS
ncbi:hypothetical protein Scep_027478 [Stephania cephalantha]|uniref:Uncharacterized protein n=1 Tax=Stephania cephalantha TaxID=152367 RepID=A0AAP0HL46_9MAGN